MPKNTSVILGNHFDEFIARQLEGGRYGSASEIVRAGLRLLEDTETKLERLRELLDEGEKSGLADYRYEDLISELDREHVQ
jgi:antitoxin ParD1/3/4